jgi:hypothetical protein
MYNARCFGKCNRIVVVESDKIEKCPNCGGDIKILGKYLGFGGSGKDYVPKPWKG